MSCKVGMFAGQGAQFPGMGRDLISSPAAALLFADANKILGYDIASICFDGPIEKLTESTNCQPAIFIVSAACYALFMNRCPEIAFSAFAGLSLGEWTALYAADVIDFPTTLKILQARGRFMQEACDENQGGMVSIMALPYEKVLEIAELCGLYVANINSDAQINLAGSVERVEHAASLAKKAGGKAFILNVAGAFHSPFMESAKLKLQEFIADIHFASPKVPVYSNATGRLHSMDGEEIKAAMLNQITYPVRWRDCVVNSNSRDFVEFGPGKVLAGLTKRICRESQVLSIQDMASLNAAIC